MPNPTPTQADREEAARLLPCSIDPDRPCRDDPERCLNRERCHLPAMCDPCSALEDLAAALAARDAAARAEERERCAQRVQALINRHSDCEQDECRFNEFFDCFGVFSLEEITDAIRAGEGE